MGERIRLEKNKTCTDDTAAAAALYVILYPVDWKEAAKGVPAMTNHHDDDGESV